MGRRVEGNCREAGGASPSSGSRKQTLHRQATYRIMGIQCVPDRLPAGSLVSYSSMGDWELRGPMSKEFVMDTRSRRYR